MLARAYLLGAKQIISHRSAILVTICSVHYTNLIKCNESARGCANEGLHLGPKTYTAIRTTRRADMRATLVPLKRAAMSSMSFTMLSRLCAPSKTRMRPLDKVRTCRARDHDVSVVSRQCETTTHHSLHRIRVNTFVGSCAAPRRGAALRNTCLEAAWPLRIHPKRFPARVQLAVAAALVCTCGWP